MVSLDIELIIQSGSIISDCTSQGLHITINLLELLGKETSSDDLFNQCDL